MRTRDSQRSKVTRAMWSVPSTPITRKDAIARFERLRRTKWFARTFYCIRGFPMWDAERIIMRWTKSHRALPYAIAWRYRLRKPGLVKLGAAHGREFCAALLVIIRKLEGPAVERAVRQALKTHGARYTKPRQQRDMSELEKAGLRARLDGMRAERTRGGGSMNIVTGELILTPERCLRCGKPYIPGDPFASHTLDCRWYGND